MTHSDIYTKFMIEYDKANVTSSYPSLTPYEIATILDKAYLALIAEKLTGNNLRQVGFEQDTKAIEDLQPLVVTKELKEPIHNAFIENQYDYKRPEDVLYYITGLLKTDKAVNAIDKESHVTLPVHLVSHDTARRFFATNNNLPWIPEPVVYEETNRLSVLVDSYKLMRPLESLDFRITYIKYPAKFALTTEPNIDDIPTGQPVVPTDEEKWFINPISGTNTVYNANNYLLYTTSSYSNKGNTSDVIFSLTSGMKYATITSTGNLVVLPSATMYSSVTIKATCANNPNVSARTNIMVKYYLEGNKPSSSSSSSQSEQDYSGDYFTISGPDTAYNASNKVRYTTNLPNGSFSIKLGSEFASISSDGTLTIFESESTSANKVIITASDGSRYVDKEIMVHYYSSENQQSGTMTATFDFTKPMELNPSIEPLNYTNGPANLPSLVFTTGFVSGDVHLKAGFWGTYGGYVCLLTALYDEEEQKAHCYLRITEGTSFTFSVPNGMSLTSIEFDQYSMRGGLYLKEGEPGVFKNVTWNSNGQSVLSVEFRVSGHESHWCLVTVKYEVVGSNDPVIVDPTPVYSDLRFEAYLKPIQNEWNAAVGNGAATGLPVSAGIVVWETDDDGKSMHRKKSVSNDYVLDYMRDYYSDYIWDILYQNVVVDPQLRHTNGLTGETKSASFTKWNKGPVSGDINYSTDTIALINNPTLFEIYSNPSLYRDRIIDNGGSKDPDDYTVVRTGTVDGKNKDHYYINDDVYIKDAISYKVKLNYGPASNIQTKETNVVLSMKADDDLAVAMAVGILRNTTWSLFMTDPLHYIDQMEHNNQFTKYYCKVNAQWIWEQEFVSYAKGPMLTNPGSIGPNDIFVMLRKDLSFIYNAAIMIMSCPEYFDGMVVPGNDNMVYLVEYFGLQDWVNNQNMTGVAKIEEGGRNYYEGGTHRILDENGKRKYFSLPYEQEVLTFDNSTVYKRYGGPDYLLTAFAPRTNIEISKIEFVNANTFNLI